jgi:hypothetical protein
VRTTKLVPVDANFAAPPRMAFCFKSFIDQELII